MKRLGRQSALMPRQEGHIERPVEFFLQSADCVVSVRHGSSSEGGWQCHLEGETALPGGSGGLHGVHAGDVRCASWLAAGSDRSALLHPLASLQAKANQHQRELMKEFGENCAEFSEVEHLVKVRADKQAAMVDSTRLPTDMRALPSTEWEWEDALRILAKPKLWA